MNRIWMVTFKKIVLLGLPAVLLSLFAVYYWLLHTTPGSAWLWNQLEDRAAGSVRTAFVGGDLASGFVIQALEYQSDTVDLSVARAEIQVVPGWWPVSIQIRALDLQDVEIIMPSNEASAHEASAPTSIHTILVALKLPLPLNIHQGLLSNITLHDAGEEPAIAVESIRFQVALDERLEVDQLDILALGVQTKLQGHLVLEPPFHLLATLEGRLEMTTQSGAVVSLPDLRLSTQGHIDDWSLSVDTTVQSGTAANYSLSVSGSGSTRGFQLSAATLSGPGVTMDISGKLDWSSHIEAGLSADIIQLDLSPWLQDWPAGEYLAGQMALNWSENRLKIPAGRLTVTGSDLAIDIEADIDVEANRVDARLAWSSFSWPLFAANPDFSSSFGQLSVTGSFDQWTTTGHVDLQLGDYPPGQFVIQASGDRTAARLSILKGELLGGSVSGKASVDWAGDLIWDAAFFAHGVDPEPLVPGWPGRLDANIEISAQSQPQAIKIDLITLQGLLRGVPVSAHGGVALEDDEVRFNGFELRTDAAELQLDGSMTGAAGVSVKFNGDLPSVFLHGAVGHVELAGRYSSHARHHLLDLHLEARELAWNEYNLSQLVMSTKETGTTAPVPSFQLSAAGLRWQQLKLDELTLSLRPADDQYRLTFSLASETDELRTAITLSPEDTDNPFAGTWSGLVDEMEGVIDEVFSFELQQPAPLEWSPDSVLIGPLCLRGNRGEGLCLSVDYQAIGDWSLVADVTAVPVDYLRDILDLDVHFEQLIEGRLEWHQPHDQAPTGGAELRITAGGIVDIFNDELLAESRQGKFAFALRNGNLESGVLDIEFPGTGFIDIDFDVLDIIGGGDQLLKGRAVVQLDDINLPGQLILPGVDEIDGHFESNIQLGGTLAEPALNGNFKFSDGLLRYDPLGVMLEEIEFEGRVEQHDRGYLKGQFRAGEGIGSIDGRFLFDDLDNMRMDIAFSGDQLLLIDTDVLKIVTETDLEIGLGPQRLEINGHIRVPSARLTPSNLLFDRVNDSEDLVIETRDSDLAHEMDNKPPENRFYGQLEVAFGEDVLIRIPGVETTINGSVIFNWSGEPVPLATGRYDLQGKVDVYGPTLVINNGHISFPGVLADNPLLNIRAERDIFGNTQIRTAGVQLIGTLKRPQLQAYTVPATNQDRAWTLLVTGTDFDQGQGVGGFDVGTYIAPRLYVSYGISLFEDENVVSARYDLKKGFGIKVTSGQRETGLDVSYTIER
jgi:translocation and assembly module TamB